MDHTPSKKARYCQDLEKDENELVSETTQGYCEDKERESSRSTNETQSYPNSIMAERQFDTLHKKVVPAYGSNRAKKDIIQRVLTKHLRLLLKDLRPEQILDDFEDEDVFGENTKVRVRDIRELNQTTEKNRKIVDTICQNPNLYKVLKKSLLVTSQGQLLKKLRDKENEVHEEKVKGRIKCCTDGQKCVVLQEIACPVSGIRKCLPRKLCVGSEYLFKAVIQQALTRHEKVHDKATSLDHFLHENQLKIFGKLILREKSIAQADDTSTTDFKRYCFVCEQYRKILFPDFATKTDFEKWDVGLLSFIALEICECEIQDISYYTKQLEKIRNELCHKNESHISDEEILDYDEQIEETFKKLFKLMGHSSMPDTSKEELESSIAEEQLEKWYKFDKRRMRYQKLTKLASAQGAVLVAETGRALDRIGADEFITPPLTEIVVENESDCQSTNCRCSSADEILFNAFKTSLREDEELKESVSESDLHKVEKNLRQTTKKLRSHYGIEIRYVERGCVLLQVQGHSFSTHLQFLRDVADGNVKELIADLNIALQTCIPCAKLNLYITRTEWQRCMAQIGTELRGLQGRSKQDEVTSLMDGLSLTPKEEDDVHARSEVDIADKSMQPDRFNNRKYGNWVKNILSLLYLKEGVTKFSNEKAGEFHQKVTERVGLKSTRASRTKCTKCTHKSAITTKAQNKKDVTWRINCSYNVCSVWLEEILPYHSHLPLPKIAWANSNPQLWPLDDWEMAKLFQPYGCETHKKAEDSDCAALLTMMLDCTFFHKYLTNTARLREIKEVRNACMHSRDQEIDDQEMMRALDLMVALLEEPDLKNRPECTEAKLKILQLRDNALDISLNKDLEIRALNNKVAEVRADMERDIGRLNDERKQMKTDLNDITGRQGSTVEECNELRARIVTNRQEIAELRNKDLEIRALNNKIAEVRADMERDIGRLNDEQQQMKTDLNDIKSCQYSTVEECNELRARMADNRQKMAEMTKNWHSIQQTHDPSIGGKVDYLTSKLQDLQIKIQADYEDLFENVQTTMAQFEARLHDIETQKAEEKQQTEELFQSTTEDLLKLYSEHRLKVQIFPLRTGDVKDLFVKQSFIVVAHRGEHTFNDSECIKNTESKLEHISDIFYSGEKSYRDVYIVGECGSGKSTLCEYLMYLWVKKHSEVNSEAGKLEDEDFMGNFSLLFYISLREANSKDIWDIEDMIKDQFSYLKLTKEDISKLMLDYTCLIILDGLDEYSQKHPNCAEYVSPSIPWRYKNNKLTILTTSRPWKMELLASERGVKIDRHIRITGLETKSQTKLANNVITLLNSKDEVKEEKNVNDFICDMKKQQLDKYMETPILLMQMLGLWFEGESFGKSQCEIYSKIINKQLQFASDVKKVPAATSKEKTHLSGKLCAEMSIEEENFDAQIPSCFESQRYCQKYQGLLLKLSKLAYHHLFGSQESALVFDHDQMEIMGFSEEEINTSLHLGFLTQYNVLDKITQRQKSISFVHKSHQEFFAAIYLWQTGLGSDLKKLLASFTDLDSVLQIEKSLTFISGMNTKVACEIAKVIMSLASQDARVQQYRETCLFRNAPNAALVQQIQGVILAAIEESRNNGRKMPAIPLQDLWIKGGHRDFSPTRLLAVKESLKLSDVKSIFIGTPSDTPRDVIQSWIERPKQLGKLVLRNCEISVSCIMDIVKKHRDSLQALGLYYYGVDALDLCHLSQRDLAMILSPTSLGLAKVVVSHEQLELIYTHLARRPHTEVRLVNLRCQSHGYKGCTPRLNLSTSTKLRRLTLVNLPLQDVKYEPRCLLRCQIGDLPDTVAFHVLQRLTEARSLEEFCCISLTETALVEMVRILPQLNTLTHILLVNMDLRGQQPIVLHNTTALKQIDLSDVTLASSQLHQLLAGLPSHSVLVGLGHTDYNVPVTITDCLPQDNLIQQLAASSHTKVTRKPEVTYQDDKCVVKVFNFYHKQ